MSGQNTTAGGWLAVMMLSALVACSSGSRGSDNTAAAPVDSVPEPSQADTSGAPDVATPPIVPQPESRSDTPPSGPAAPAQPKPAGGGPNVSRTEYEGWRQYSVNCARCHGQDVLPNPVAANLLISLGPGGPIGSEQEFLQVVTEGRPERGMPAFKGVVSPEQSRAIYAYVKGRADKRIPAGRPASPS